MSTDTGRWKIAEAKARFSHVLREASTAPQVIMNRGRQVAVVLSPETYHAFRAMASEMAPKARMADFLQFTEKLRQEPGMTLETPVRSTRNAPFSDEEAY